MPAIFNSVAFLDPIETITAQSFGEVTNILEFAEMRAHSGAYVLVMLSYEAAPAFDSALCTQKPDDFPLAWVGVFSEPSDPIEIRSVVSSNPWLPKVTRDEYNECVARIRELIAAGDTYQVNYSFRLTSSFTGDPLAWFHALRGGQRAEYSAYLDLGRYKILSLSPELFFERHGDHVRTKPMKGTVQRGSTDDEDAELARWLQNSIKNRAENVMIVDLLRNDLGKVSVPGGVHVTSLFDLERFETVWQMTSTVEATLKNGTSLVDLIGALFPCGSVTGAPKIRTMQIIRELERFPRGAYTGTIGLLRPGGDCTFNVAIRTVVLDTDTNLATCSVGGGITIDSTAEDEYQECLVKSRFLHAGKDLPQALRRKGNT
ncbi:MAG TPA: aminodeoxychorismate synthase component I [Pyrinomonadaceae bacterium]|nr:aminodeoxychorismate synthase component I [Pyrinomonadaceae bacterium]